MADAAIRSPATAPPVARHIGAVNLRGMATLYAREMRRGLKSWGITLAAPAIRAVLMALIFSLALGGADATMGAMPFHDFLAAGLVAAAVLERAFESAAFSMVYDKTEGILTDLAAWPLTPIEVIAAYAAAATSGALLSGMVVWAALLPLGCQLPAAPGVLLAFTVGGALMVGLFSQIAGLWAAKWDQLAGVQTFIFLPVVFLSGVFYALDRLPPDVAAWARANPLFYVVDGIRFAITGQSDANPWIGAAVVAASVLVLAAASYRLFRIGYRFKI